MQRAYRSTGNFIGLCKEDISVGLTPSKRGLGQDFSLPNKPIYVDYEDQDERFIADQIVKHLIFPILRRAKVNVSDLLSMLSLDQ